MIGFLVWKYMDNLYAYYEKPESYDSGLEGILKLLLSVIALLCE